MTRPKAAHTPLPWRLEPGRIDVHSPCIVDANGVSVAEMWGSTKRDKANAEFLLRAVNLHHKLVKALRDAWCHQNQMTPTAREAIREALDEVESVS